MAMAKLSKGISRVRQGVPEGVPARTLCVFCVLFCKLFAHPSLGLPGDSLTCVRGPWPVVCQGLPARICSLPAIRIAPARFPTTGQGHALATLRICAEASACFALRFRGGKLSHPLCVCVLYVVCCLDHGSADSCSTEVIAIASDCGLMSETGSPTHG
jgi:hypothetical protein